MEGEAGGTRDPLWEHCIVAKHIPTLFLGSDHGVYSQHPHKHILYRGTPQIDTNIISTITNSSFHTIIY